MRKDTASVNYFARYTFIQATKHYVLRHYLGGWFGKIGRRFPRAVYIETHAGAGVHAGGQMGSPIVALDTLLTHSSRDAILAKCAFEFVLIEEDPENCAKLRALVAGMKLPPRVAISFDEKDFREEFAQAAEKDSFKAPVFTFVDPFGYEVPLGFVRALLGRSSGEVTVTFMSQAAARASRDGTKTENLTTLYGSEIWRPLAQIDDFEERKVAAVKLYKESVGARWCTTLRMKAQTDYSMMHFTNNPEGRRIMKDAMWKADESGDFMVTGKLDPRQPLLIVPEPDLRPLELQLRQQLGGKTVTHTELMDWNLDTDYRDPHLNKVLTRGRKEGWIVTPHTGKVGRGMETAPITIGGL